MGFNEVRRAKEWKLEQRRFIEGRYKRRGVEPSVSLDGKEVDLNKYPDRSIALDKIKLAGNGAGFNAVIRKIDNKSLIDHIYKCLINVCVRPDQDISYEESLMNILLPELLDRFEEIDREINSKRYVDDPKIVLKTSEEFNDLFSE